MISFVALWVGGLLVPTLLNGFVLAAVPAFVARAATVTRLGCGAGLALVAFRLAERPEDSSSLTPEPTDGEDPGALASHV